jgi:hypothetical protein
VNCETGDGRVSRIRQLEHLTMAEGVDGWACIGRQSEQSGRCTGQSVVHSTHCMPFAALAALDQQGSAAHAHGRVNNVTCVTGPAPHEEQPTTLSPRKPRSRDCTTIPHCGGMVMKMVICRPNFLLPSQLRPSTCLMTVSKKKTVVPASRERKCVSLLALY